MVAVTVQNLTKEINCVGVGHFKDKIESYMKRFDFESTTEKSKCKHYVLDYLCDNSPEEKLKALEIIASACWARLLNDLQAHTVNNRAFVRECTWDDRFKSKPLKIGKVYMCAPNRFETTNTDVHEPQLFSFGYESDNGYEIQGEINFGVEIY